MGLYSENKYYKLYLGKMQDELKNIDSNSIDSIVTDPPYELNFMSKDWDNSGVAFQKETWQECLRVLKPGGYLLAFGGSRTFHRIAVAIEDAGFEIRDTIMWLYGSGFPKSMNIGLAIDKKNGVESEVSGIKPGHEGFINRKTDGHMKFTGGMDGFDRPWMHDSEKREAYHYQKVPTSNSAKRWSGWGTCLKPAYEPIIMARKPLEGSCTDNILKYGVGGINIDECRVEAEINRRMCGTAEKCGETSYVLGAREETYTNKGRFPANVILTYDETDYEEVCGNMPVRNTPNGSINREDIPNSTGDSGIYSKFSGNHLTFDAYQDSGSASRYFYCAKASKKDRDDGLDEFITKTHAEINNRKEGSAGCERSYGGGTNPYLSVSSPRKNTHPTVKPTELMQYLIRLISPKGATILDPFMGSGSTGKAAMIENVERGADYKFIGIEMTEEYLPICQARINFGLGYAEETPKVEIKEEAQVDIEDKKVFRKVSLF